MWELVSVLGVLMMVVYLIVTLCVTCELSFPFDYPVFHWCTNYIFINNLDRILLEDAGS